MEASESLQRGQLWNAATRNKDGLSNCIRQLRFEHGRMTQQQLAHRVSVTRQTIVALESGRYSPSLPLAMRIARVFCRPVEEVFNLAFLCPESDMAAHDAPAAR